MSRPSPANRRLEEKACRWDIPVFYNTIVEKSEKLFLYISSHASEYYIANAFAQELKPRLCFQLALRWY